MTHGGIVSLAAPWGYIHKAPQGKTEVKGKRLHLIATKPEKKTLGCPCLYRLFLFCVPFDKTKNTTDIKM